MHITILGSGNVGHALGSGWLRAGHTVTYARRSPDPDGLPAGARVTTYADAVRDTDVLVLCTPWKVAADVVRALGDVGGRPLLDATNPIGPGFVSVAPADSSGAEELQRIATNAHVVKIFNTVGADIMADATFTTAGGERIRPMMTSCGDHAPSNEIAAQLAGELGFEPVHVGGLANATLLEAQARLWITLSMRGSAGRQFAFARVTR